jgi:MoaA/NifB/PqqE/SkfB family radical SAM enzyme
VLGPQSLSVVLTNACNLTCVTCWSYSPLLAERPAASWSRRRLERPLLEGLFADLAELHTERVIFTGGGDPLAHPEFVPIARQARAAGLKVTLISNLTLVRDRDAFLSLGLNTVLANFSCADEETYVAFHPGRTAEDYRRLLQTLRALSAAGTELKLVFVVCRINAGVLGRLIDVAGHLGAGIQLKLMSAAPDTRELVLSAGQRDSLFARRSDLARRAAEAGVRVNLDAFYAALSGESPETFPIETVGCWAGHYYARVDAVGDVRYCCNPCSDLRIGSLHEAGFADLWWSDRWQTLREQLGAGRFVPGCERCGKWDLNLRIAAQNGGR